MTTRIISKPTGKIDPSAMFIVQFAQRGLLGIKWVSLKRFESYKIAKEFERKLK